MRKTALELTDSDFQDLLAQDRPAKAQTIPSSISSLDSGIQSRLPSQLGEGGDRLYELRNGLTVGIRKGRLWQPIRHFRQHEVNFPLVAKFYLSGRSRIQTLDASDIDSDYREMAGYHYLYHLPSHSEIEEWPADYLIHGVKICVHSDYFSTFGGAFGQNQDALPAPLQRWLKGNKQQRFYQPLGQMTPHLRQLVQDIVQCPYSGLMQQLYLESKALELLTAQFSIWAEQQSESSAVSLSTEEVDQLHLAKEILVSRAKSPPSLAELATSVRLNDRKLNQGFRRLFGTTVFGYLRVHRLQQAKSMLQDDSLTIAVVAATVGYRNSEAFSTAFRREFAVSPKAYQLSRRS